MFLFSLLFFLYYLILFSVCVRIEHICHGMHGCSEDSNIVKLVLSFHRYVVPTLQTHVVKLQDK